MVYYVVAHEVAHQWWGHQVLGPRMQGSTMMVESMAQYTALMVLEKEYGRPAMRRFLKYERDNYLRGRGQEGRGEMPLVKVEGQQYIHYNKGSVVMYGLREFIGEERVNAAYRAFVDSFAFKGAPYPTTLDLYRSLETVTPDSLRYMLEDGLKHITFYRNAIATASATPNTDGSWTVTASFNCAKLHADPTGKEKEVPMNDWIDVGVRMEGGDEEKQRIRLRSGTNQVRLHTSHKPLEVVLDPDHLFFDRDGADDRRVL
jgi:ABC-2 type transport system permease protein